MNRGFLYSTVAIAACAMLLVASPMTAVATGQYTPLPEDSGEISLNGSGHGTYSVRPDNGSGSASPGQSGATSAQAPEMADLDAYARELFDLVNQERIAAGLEAVYWEADFATCAQIRAEELTRKFGHERPEPPQASSRETWPENTDGRGGVYNAPTVADELGIDYNWIMENASHGKPTPSDVVQGWMNSDGHRGNLLKDTHVRGAAGVWAVPTDYGYYYYWILWLDR